MPDLASFPQLDKDQALAVARYSLTRLEQQQGGMLMLVVGERVDGKDDAALPADDAKPGNPRAGTHSSSPGRRWSASSLRSNPWFLRQAHTCPMPSTQLRSPVIKDFYCVAGGGGCPASKPQNSDVYRSLPLALAV